MTAEVVERKYKELGPLQDLLIQACPPNERGYKSIPVLAKALDMSYYGVYKWIQSGSIPPRAAMKVVEISEGRVTLNDFTPFIFL